MTSSISKRLSVSVIIPTYNRASLIPYTIESLLCQTRLPHEILVVDDGSSDNTLTILSQYGTAIKILVRPHAGRSAARNTGLEAATGDLILFLDSDDTLPPISIDRRAKILEERSDIDVVYSDAQWIDIQGNEQGLWSTGLGGPSPSGFILAELAHHMFIPIHTAMIRRTSIGNVRFDETLEYCEDYDFWLRLAPTCQFLYLHEPLANYRRHAAGTISTAQQEVQEAALLVRNRVIQRSEFKQLNRKLQARVYCQMGIGVTKLGKIGDARRYFFRSIQVAPDYPHAYILVAASMMGQNRFSQVVSQLLKFKKRIKQGRGMPILRQWFAAD